MCSCTTFSILLPSSSCVVVMRDESHAKAARSTGGLNGYRHTACGGARPFVVTIRYPVWNGRAVIIAPGRRSGDGTKEERPGQE